MFTAIGLLEDVLREFPSVQVVISSCWRELHPMDEMREYFAPDLRPRILGATPLTYSESELPAGAHGFVRQCECLEWMRRQQPAGTLWIALDDQASLFNPSCENLLIVDGRFGCTTRDMERLRRRLHTMAPPTELPPDCT